MAATTSYQAIGPVRECRSSFGAQNGIRNLSVKMVSKGFGVDVRLITRGNCRPESWKLGVIHGSGSHSSVVDPEQMLSKNNSSNSKKKSGKSCSSAALVIHWKPSRLYVRYCLF